MDTSPTRPCVAFAGTRLIASGELATVARLAKATLDANANAQVLVLDAITSEPVEVDFRGTAADVVGRLTPPPQAPRSPGRPKLGVVGREVTLLPRHWEWLSGQPGGASVTLRKLVDSARRSSGEQDRQRLAREAAYRFMVAIAGNEPGFEEASRALFAGDRERFDAAVESWPPDVRARARQLAAAGL